MKKLKNRKMTWTLPFIVTLFLLNILPTTIHAQCKDKGINQVVVVNGKLSVTFDQAVSSMDALGDPSRWRIVRISTGVDPTPITISNVSLKNIGPPADRFWFAELSFNGVFETGKKYLLYVEGLTFNGCDPKKEAFSTISLPAPQPTNPPAKSSAYEAEKANGRNDADIYVSGNLEGVRGESAVKTIDLKFELPIPVRVIQDDNLIIPYFDLKASSNAKADADSLKTGVILRSASNWPDLRYFRGLVWDLDGRVEANKNLRFMNGIVSNKFSFVTKPFGDGKVQFYIQPFVGFELGRNMRTPVAEAVGQNVVRPNFGASAFLNIWIEKPLLDSISVQSDFIRRWSLTSEVGVNKDGDNFVPVFAGRGPRDYTQTKIEFGFNKFVGLSLGHEYGSLPPNFKLLDNKYTIGLTFKALLLRRPK